MKFLNDPMNLEFVRLLNVSGWSKSRAAEELRLQNSTISEYVNGNARPSQTVIQLFKLTLLQAQPDLMREVGQFSNAPKAPAPKLTVARTASGYGVEELVAEIGQIDPQQQPQAIEALRGVVKAFPKAKPARKNKAA